MKSKILALSKNEEFKNLLTKKKISNKYATIFFGTLRNIVNDAVKKVSLKFHYSYLVIAKPTMLNNEFKNIKETLFQEFEKIK